MLLDALNICKSSWVAVVQKFKMIFIENWRSSAVEEDKLNTQPLGPLLGGCINTPVSVLSGQQTCCVAIIKLLLWEQLESRNSYYLVHLLA